MSRTSTELGRVLGQRYRIVAPIGAGASARVFVAEDLRLRRRVAVKMLHADLAGDDDFLRRFHAEARAAAGLNHPHVLAVFDWGEDDDQPYLVTEYLSGGSLRALLDRGARLRPAQALRVGLEASRALDHAHRRGVVHGDVTPSSLLFGDEGRLRVADFGLSRTLTGPPDGDPDGVVLGSIRYASPEQADGRAAVAASDVYALALVLVESVTGAVPFAADTSIGTLAARVGHDLEVPAALGPLAGPLSAAGLADPERRADARELGVALMAAAPQLDRPDPLPLAGVLVGAGAEPGAEAPGPVDPVDPEAWAAPTVAVPTAAGPPPDAPQVGGPGGAGPGGAGPGAAVPGAGSVDVLDAVDPAPFEHGYDEIVYDDYEDLPRRRGWILVTLVLLLLGLSVLGGLALVGASEQSVPRVPALTGLQLTTARSRIARNGWTVVEEHTRKDDTRPGQVLATDPAVGTQLRKGDKLTLLVSDGPTLVTVPGGVRDQPLTGVTQLYTAIGLKVSTTSRFDEEVAQGNVIELAPGTPQQLPKGSTVAMVVSDGPAPRTVPDGLLGSGYGDAVDKLDAIQLNPVRVDQYNDDKSVPAGTVFDVQPKSGAVVPRGADVTLYVSAGPTPVGIPQLANQTQAQATAALGNLGFYVTVSQAFSDTVPNGLVIGTQPGAGSTAQPGTTVNLVVSKGPDLVTVPPVLGTATPQEAAARLAAFGLTPGNVIGPATGKPIATSPPANSRVKRGTVVTIVLG